MSNIRWSHKMHQRFRMRFQLNIRFYWCLWSSKFDLEVLHLRIFQWNNSTDMKILDFRFEWPIYTKSGQRIQIWHQNPFYVNFKHYVIAKNDIEVLRYTNLYKIEVKEFKFEVKTKQHKLRHHYVIVESKTNLIYIRLHPCIFDHYPCSQHYMHIHVRLGQDMCMSPENYYVQKLK